MMRKTVEVSKDEKELGYEIFSGRICKTRDLSLRRLFRNYFINSTRSIVMEFVRNKFLFSKPRSVSSYIFRKRYIKIILNVSPDNSLNLVRTFKMYLIYWEYSY